MSDCNGKYKKYFIVIDEEYSDFENHNSLIDGLKSEFNKSSGRLSVDGFLGERKGWKKIIFGKNWHVDTLLMVEWVEWVGELAALIFIDSTGSEYRAKDDENTVIDENLRDQIFFGEIAPVERKYCINKGRVIDAASELIKTGVKPKWLAYDYIE